MSSQLTDAIRKTEEAERQSMWALGLSVFALALAIFAFVMSVQALAKAGTAKGPAAKEVHWGPLAKPPSFAGNILLDAIAEVESGWDHGAVGRAGERGAYQMMRTTWSDRTSLPFSLAHDPEISRKVAEDHLRWLRKTLTKWMGSEPSDAQLAASWNCGIGRLRTAEYDVKRVPKSTRMYVSKVLNVASQRED